MKNTTNFVRVIRIKKDYFEENTNLIEVLDSEKVPIEKEKRMYMGLLFKRRNNFFFAPLRKHNPGEKYADGLYEVPTTEFPDAVLDFRKSLLIKETFLKGDVAIIPNDQYQHIKERFSDIEEKFNSYVSSYIKSAYRGRNHIEELFQFSSLVNFHDELGVNCLKDIKEMKKAIVKLGQRVYPKSQTQMISTLKNLHRYSDIHYSLDLDENYFAAIDASEKNPQMNEFESLEALKFWFEDKKSSLEKSKMNRKKPQKLSVE